MTKSKTTKRALLFSVLSLILCASMLIGSTYSWFTDTVATTQNKIIAGNLDIALKVRDTAGNYNEVRANQNLFGEALWEPGHVEVVNLKLENLGTLALKYKFGINVPNDEKEYPNALGGTFKLSTHIQYAVINGEETFGTGDTERARAIAMANANNPQPLSELHKNEDGVLYAKDNLPADGVSEKTVTLIVFMPTTVTNEANYRGTEAPTIDLGVTLEATQIPYEQDSFGDNYDANAWMDEYGTPNTDGTVNLDGKDYIKDDNGGYAEVKKNEETGLYETVVPEGEASKSYVSDNGEMVEVQEDAGTTGLYNGVGAGEGKTYAKGSEGVVPVKENEAVNGLYEEVVGEGEAAGALFLNCDNSLAEVEEEVPGLYNTVTGDKHFINDSNAIVEVEQNTAEYGLYKPVSGENKLYAKDSDGVASVTKDTSIEGLYTADNGDKYVATTEAFETVAPQGGNVSVIDNIEKKFTSGDGSKKTLDVTTETPANIDLSDKAISIESSNGQNGIKVNEGANATFSNGTITMNKGYGDYAVVDAEHGEITLDNMTVENLAKDGQCVSAGTDGGKVTIKDSTIIGGDSAFSPAVFCSSQSTVVIENSTIIGGIRAGSNSKVELRGGDYRKAILRSENKDRIIIYSGLFSVDPTVDPQQLYTHGAKLAPGSKLINNGDGTWTVTEG